MLLNGLGTLINSELENAKRFIDLFTGSAAVAWFVATKHDVPVYAYDLQRYSTALANAVISRTKVLSSDEIWREWETRAKEIMDGRRYPSAARLTQAKVQDIRRWCSRQELWTLTKAYGGHYFSAKQAMWLDALRKTLPKNFDAKRAALGALIEGASQCAAAPGHTAQPFQPTRSAKPFLQEAWDRDIRSAVKRALSAICKMTAKQKGRASACDANQSAGGLKEGDLVFVDPPYSGVHYSRFYHVLESLARGRCGEVSGVGRYPSNKQRPRSKYSVVSESVDAVDNLLKTLSAKKTRVIFTFPEHECSNGLSGERVRTIANKYFVINEQAVASRFSTLGGYGGQDVRQDGRAARHDAKELILLLSPK